MPFACPTFRVPGHPSAHPSIIIFLAKTHPCSAIAVRFLRCWRSTLRMA